MAGTPRARDGGTMGPAMRCLAAAQAVGQSVHRDRGVPTQAGEAVSIKETEARESLPSSQEGGKGLG